MAVLTIDHAPSRARMVVADAFTVGRCDSCDQQHRELHEVRDFGDADALEQPARWKVCVTCLP